MTTAELAPGAAMFRIVVCGTCDVVFRTHPGRPTCPCCGGDPDLELGEGTIEIFPSEPSSPTEGEAPAPAEEPRVEEPELVQNPVTGWHHEAEPEAEEETSPPEAGEGVSTDPNDI